SSDAIRRSDKHQGVFHPRLHSTRNYVMHIVRKICLGTTLALTAGFGCSAAPDGNDESTAMSTEAIGLPRCTVRGNPPVTTGCQEDQFCSVNACTNSIPLICFGVCQPKRSLLKLVECIGAFNCLCGTPTCVDGEWTCVGDCSLGGTS